MLVVDEAHHLHWQEDGQHDPAYQLVEQLASQTQGVLLLTATPENTGIEGHFARLRLLDPERFPSLATFREEQAGYEDISELIQGLLDAPEEKLQNPRFVQSLEQYLGTVPSTLQTDPAARETAVADLLDRFGTGRLLFRNTRASVGGFPRRQLQAHPLEAPAGYSELTAQASLAQLLQPESLLGPSWLSDDPRVQWLEKGRPKKKCC